MGFRNSTAASFPWIEQEIELHLYAEAQRVVKFKVSAQQLLLAYPFDAKRNVIEVLAVVGGSR